MLHRSPWFSFSNYGALFLAAGWLLLGGCTVRQTKPSNPPKATSSESQIRQADHESVYGLVGLRALPRSRAEAIAVAGELGSDIPLYDESLQGLYPYVAQEIDVLYGGFDGDEFVTKKVFFEYYWGLSPELDDLDPKKNKLVGEIRRWEDTGHEVVHILICREYLLMKDQGFPEAEPGPFEEDTRILSMEDVTNIRSMFRNAHTQGLLKNDDYRLVQMVEHPSFFAENERTWPILRAMDGIAYEVHQFNRHWPLESGWSQPDKVIAGARWALENDRDYIFYYGPIIWHSDDYEPFIERTWMETFWRAGLPKRNPRMHYYLNLFPHAHGCGRPVGPESDPHSTLGFTKWVIEQVKTPED